MAEHVFDNLLEGGGIVTGPSTGTRTPTQADGAPLAPPVSIVEPEAPGLTIEEMMAAVERSEALKGDPVLQAEHKGVDWTKTLAALPEDARKLMSNLRADATRKQQAAAEQSRKLTEAQARLDAERTALTNSEAYKRIKALSEQTVGEYDPYNPDNMLAHMKKMIAEQQLEMLKPVIEQQQKAEAQATVARFQAEHPDFGDLKKDIAKELQSSEHLTVEQAYYIVKARVDSTKAQKTQAELEEYRKVAKAAGLRVSTGTRPAERVPPSSVKGAVAIMNWLKAQGN